jgi:hypothetical protein
LGDPVATDEAIRYDGDLTFEGARPTVIRFVTGHTTDAESLSRREWLRIGGLAGLSTLARQARSNEIAARVPGFGRARSVIIIYANGGQSQLEMWDPKPDAPAEIRGEFGTIATSVPGTILGEHLPRVAKLAHRYAILRSVSHDDLDHGSATYLALTGRFHAEKSGNPPIRPTDFPTLGAVVTRVRPRPNSPYTSVHVNAPGLMPELPSAGQNAGFLGRAFEPLVVGNVATGDTALPDLSPGPDLPPVRLEGRRTLLQSIDQYRRELPHDRILRDMDGLYARAYDLLGSTRYRKVFDLSEEPPALRERYGLNRTGQACLLARRLAEAEVPLVVVMCNQSNRGQDNHADDPEAYGWDTHNDIFSVMRDRLLPRFDQSFSALLEDLDTRGLLDQTLVICMGEFGRAPRIALEARFAGATPGRKHWANVYSVVLAGAGVVPGLILGSSDRISAYPQSHRVTPCDLHATILSSLGLDPHAEFRDSMDRPFPLSVGDPIEGLYRGG